MTPRVHIEDDASGQVRIDYYFPAGFDRREGKERILFVVRSRKVLWVMGRDAQRAARRVGIHLPEGGEREIVLACPMRMSRDRKILGDDPRLPVIVFSFPRSMPPHAALQTYEQACQKLGHIPPIELLTAVLAVAADRLKKKKRPYLIVTEMYTEIAAVWVAKGVFTPAVNPSAYWPSSALDTFADQFARALFTAAFSGNSETELKTLMEHSFSQFQAVSDMAYLCYALGDVLASERFARWLAMHLATTQVEMDAVFTFHNSTVQLALGGLGLSALGVTLRSDGRFIIEIRGRQYAVGSNALPWEQFLEVALLSDRGLYAFTRGKYLPGSQLTIERAWSSLEGDSFSIDDVPTMTWDEAKPWADTLLADAQENAAYTPSGFYRIILPENSLLRPWGVSGISLWVEDGLEQIWVGLVSENTLGAVFRWQPERCYPFSPLVVPASIAGFVHLHLAALWRDLRVVGKEVLVDEKTFRQPRENWATGGGPSHPKNGRRARKMPRTRLSGARYWGSYATQKRIEQAAHRIDGHKRHLPEGRKASASARALAREHYILLPEDGRITYVRPHIKGKDRDAEGFPEAERPVDALGLATLMTFKDLHRHERHG